MERLSHLPSIPDSWNALTWKQLCDVWHILLDMPQNASDEMKALSLYQYFTGAQIAKVDESATPDGSKDAYLLTIGGKSGLVRVGELHAYLLGVHINDSQITYDVVGVMEWLPHPNTLTQLPIEHINIGHRKYRVPAPMITSLTYQQYGNMQKILHAYWDVAKDIRQLYEQSDGIMELMQGGLLHSSMVEDKKHEYENILKRIVTQSEVLNKLQCQFLAHALVNRSFRISSMKSGGTNLFFGWSYDYSVELAEKNIDNMRKAPIEVFYILQQYLQSCLEWYRQQMPDLFSESSKVDIRNPLMSEIDTVNAIMKWKGAYGTQQEVYDTNAIFIFGDLKDMAKEAREIEKVNSRIKHK